MRAIGSAIGGRVTALAMMKNDGAGGTVDPEKSASLRVTTATLSHW